MEQKQDQTKRSFDKKEKFRDFKEGDLVLKWDVLKSRPRRHGKFDNFWSCPFVITAYKENNAFQLSTTKGEELKIPVNGIQLKLCFQG